MGIENSIGKTQGIENIPIVTTATSLTVRFNISGKESYALSANLYISLSQPSVPTNNVNKKKVSEVDNVGSECWLRRLSSV